MAVAARARISRWARLGSGRHENVGGEAGAITAALFLDEFVGSVPWAHLDIAGPMWSNSDSGWLQKGMTGYGTRLLIDAALNFKRPSR